jgi:hypothetical protein
MILRRNSIAWLMRAVGVVALNLAVGRTIFAFEPWRLAGIGPIAVTIQAGLLFLISARATPPVRILGRLRSGQRDWTLVFFVCTRA